MTRRSKKILIFASVVIFLPLAAYPGLSLNAAASGKDAVVSRVAVVPEPGTLTLLGTGDPDFTIFPGSAVHHNLPLNPLR